MNVTYIALGSNLNAPESQISEALRSLQKMGTLCALSNWYQTKAIGPGDQPDYINGVAKLSTHLGPFALLSHLQAIEHQQGRVRHIRWGARNIDLDIILFNHATVYSRNLIIPHPRLTERPFVITPLLDIDTTLKLPDDTFLSCYHLQPGENDLILLQNFSDNMRREFL